MSVHEIESQALRLPLVQRAALAQHLIESLDEADEIERSWMEEADRRFAEVAGDTVDLIPASDVFAQIHSAHS